MNPTRCLCAFALCALALAAGTAHAEDVLDEEVFPTDPRIIEANALLEHRSGWKRSIGLYREALADNPDDLGARLHLARVLSWGKQYDESFVEYFELLDRQPGSSPIRAEYAEVLSWAGRYDESEKVFLELLDEDPRNHRAALGLARVYSWSGRSRQAQKAYERVLALAEDGEARSEYEALERGEGFGTHAKSRSAFVSDSDEFQMFQTGANASTDLNARTRVLVHAGFTKVSNGLAVGQDHSNGFDILAGVERRIGSEVSLSVEAGARRWSSSPNTALAHLQLQYTPTSQLSMGVELDYGDFLERSLSLDSVLFGVHETRGRGWLWRELSASTAAYGYLEASYLSDSNGRIAGGGSFEWTPWAERALQIGVGIHATSYTSRSVLYYDPMLDVAATLFGHGSWQLHRTTDFELRLSVGVGHTNQSLASATGVTYSVEGGPTWHYDAWLFSVVGRHSQTIRNTPYMTQSVGVNLGRGF